MTRCYFYFVFLIFIDTVSKCCCILIKKKSLMVKVVYNFLKISIIVSIQQPDDIIEKCMKNS